MALRGHAFRFSERGSSDRQLAYFRQVFLENPWQDLNCPSLVIEGDNGAITGFLGVLPRVMTLRGRAIRAAVGTQLMVSPEAGGFAGLRLVRAFKEGRQDLSLSDTANDVARRLWLAVGGHVAALQSLSWTMPVRPWRHAATQLGHGLVARAIAVAVRPLAVMADVMEARPELVAPPVDGSRLASLTAALVREHAESVLADFAVRPRYDATFNWLYERAAEKRVFGPLRTGLVLDDASSPLGWFLYYQGLNHTAATLQVAARRGSVATVLRWLAWDARSHGAIAVSGRAEPWMLPELGAAGCVFAREGPWTLWHTRDRNIEAAILADDAFFSRLDGEWWLSF